MRVLALSLPSQMSSYRVFCSATSPWARKTEVALKRDMFVFHVFFVFGSNLLLGGIFECGSGAMWG